MKYKLYYYPSWGSGRPEKDEYEFETREELGKELYKYICSGCKAGDEYDRAVYNELDLEGMLSTACGCEWGAYIDYEDGQDEVHILENEI